MQPHGESPIRYVNDTKEHIWYHSMYRKSKHKHNKSTVLDVRSKGIHLLEHISIYVIH